TSSRRKPRRTGPPPRRRPPRCLPSRRRPRDRFSAGSSSFSSCLPERLIIADTSPFGDGSVGVPPEWVAPPVALLGPFRDIVLVDVDAQTGADRESDKAFGIVEHRAIGQIVEQITAHVVVDTEALLLDEGVVRTAVDLQTGGECNWAEGTVQCDRDVVRLGHRG